MFSYQIFVRCDVYAVYLVVGHETLYPLDLGSQFSTYSTRGRVVNADFYLLRPQLCVTKLTTMNRSAAEENLRVIRELMERATIYRAVSAPGALFCGLSALLVSALALIPGPFQLLFQHNFALVGAGIGTSCVRPVNPGDGTSRLLRHGWELRSLSHDLRPDSHVLRSARRAWLILTNLIARFTRKDGLPS